MGGLGANPGDGYVQSVDYRYNIQGWLTSINNAELQDNQYNGSYSNNDADDVFGIEYVYEQTISVLNNTARYNGFVSAVKWQSTDLLNNNFSERQRAYTFDYDDRGQLREALFKGMDATGWNAEAGGYDLKAIEYDHNGNISKLDRYALYQESGSVEKMDGLSYTYSGNQLWAVEDIGTTAGFNNSVSTAQEYFYDVNGNLTRDDNKQITMSYNQFDQLSSVNHTSGSISYTHDAGGNMLTRTIVENGTTVTQEYIDGFVYENGLLKYFGSSDGLVYKEGSAFIDEYFITDQQGNVRTVFRDKVISLEYKATMEIENAVEEEQLFTFPESPVADGVANVTVGGNEVVRLNGQNPIGTSIALPVKPGDALDISVYAYYGTPESSSVNNSLTSMITATAGVFGGTNGGGEQEQFIFDAVDDALTAFGLGSANSTAPNAYLNYLFFDQEFNFIGSQSGAIPVTTASYGTPVKIGTPSTITVEKEGYVYVYLSYSGQSSEWVSFDELFIKHVAHVPEIIAQNNYYPFGMRMEGVVNNTPLNQESNQYTYNGGSEWQNDLAGLPGYLSTPFRQYDPVLGRFTGIDPLAGNGHSWTPYRYGFNNPVVFNDPTGLNEDPIFTGEPDDGYGYTGSSALFWTIQLWESAGKIGFERNARMMSRSAFNRFYGINDRNRAEFAASMGTTYRIKDEGEWVEKGWVYQDPGDSGWDYVKYMEYEWLEKYTLVAQSGGSDPSTYDRNLSEFNWLNLAAAEVTIWGGATEIAVSGPKPRYTGPKEWSKQVKTGTKFGRGLGVLGLAITGTDMLVNGVNTSNSLDATMGVVAFFGTIGAGISGAYFVGDLITVGVTGQSIGEHIDNYYWIPNPGAIGFIPVGKKPGR